MSLVEVVADTDEIFKNADFVSLHVNASPETAGSVNQSKLELMKPTAYLLNFSRGIIVKEQDLIDALKNGIIKGAALDVFEKELIEADNPLLKMNNILLSPHCSAVTTEALDRTSYGCMGIVEVLSGRKARGRYQEKRRFGALKNSNNQYCSKKGGKMFRLN